MTTGIIGVQAVGRNASEVSDKIQLLENIGIKAAWITSGNGSDPVTLLAAVAMKTDKIMLGTAIVPTWPRHPITVAQQASVLGALSPGRLRLGIGPSHKDEMEPPYGFNFRKPLTNLYEYLKIVKPLLQCGSVDFDGEMYHAHVHGQAHFPRLPVMASALRPRSFRMCGAEADGAISWVCPAKYLKDKALPAIREGARESSRTVPPLIAHTVVSVHEDYNEVKTAAAHELSMYPKSYFYQRMFAEAGFPEAENTGKWSDGMLQSVVISGSEEEVSRRIKQLFELGASELLVSIVAAGCEKRASWQRTANLLANI